MSLNKNDSPLRLSISFSKLFDHYREELKRNPHKLYIQKILDIEKEFPELSSGIFTEEGVNKYRPQIDIIFGELFSSALQHNEIKLATLPFQQLAIQSTQRYKNIIKAAGPKFEVEINNFDQDHYYLMGCSVILNSYYGYKIDFRRPFYYSIPDATGRIKNYRVLYNADYVEFEKTSKAKDITSEDVDMLLENFGNLELWKKKFPVESWLFKGFVIANIFDVTADVSISDFKTQLLRDDTDKENFTQELERIFRNIFGIDDLTIGFTNFNEEEKSIERMPYDNVRSYVLGDTPSKSYEDAFCDVSYNLLFKKNQYYVVTNAQKYATLYPENPLYKSLYKEKIQSAILASIVHEGKVLGVLEIVSPTINALNTINANKLKDIMPFLIDSVVRSKKLVENELELIIQDECTSIHSSVHWRFRQEATRYYKGLHSNYPVQFREVVFEDVFPLFGQMDIKGSSEARNQATLADLKLQLVELRKIVKKAIQTENLPIYEQIHFRIQEYLADLEDELKVDSERQVLSFIRKEINPLFKFLSSKNEEFANIIDEYQNLLEIGSGLIYKHRKDYDDTVMQINKRMSAILDFKQKEAQKMFPHYYERFKTDGVEHNLYIGKSISKDLEFNKIHLYNLRLWQLQAMCEMENSYYKLKENLPISLSVASMILAFNSSLALRFRMDEKRFDVDGTYNARYEVVKKRVDKANVKGTDDRVTQPGKITIVYSQKEDEREYSMYIKFLQHKKLLDDDLEIVELEDLQGVTGLKALRVSLLYSKGKDQGKEYYTYEDLISQLEN